MATQATPTRAVVFVLLALVLAVGTLTARACIALGSHDILEWDETYYASSTATAAHGIGLYPYVLGYPEIHAMGGLGYVIYLYVLPYRLLGADLFGLRLVSWLGSLAAVAGLGVLTRKLYGTAAGVAAAGLAPSLLLFQLSNSIRLDVFIIAFVAWVLVLYVHAAERPERTGVHALVGFVLASGLQVHLHTAAAAVGVGVAYLWSPAAALLRRRGRFAVQARRPVASFVGGYAAGLLLFLALNVLPDPTGFFRTAALARLSAADATTDLNLTARMETAKLLKTFSSPAVIVPKELARYTALTRAMPWWEVVLWAAALPAFLLLRRGRPAVHTRALFAGAIVGGALVFNARSPLYAAALLPFAVPAVASFVTHGFSRTSRVDLPDVRTASVAALAALCLAILPPLVTRTRATLSATRQTASVPPAVAQVRSVASTGCTLAGPTELYGAHFMAYPRYVGTGRVEVLIGSTYYDLQDRPVEYWRRKAPDIVVGPPGFGLDAYLSEAGYQPLGDQVWRKPDPLPEGCRIVRHDAAPPPAADRP